MTPRSLLIISGSSKIAGSENYLLSCLSRMDRTRWRPIVWVPGRSTFSEALTLAGIDVFIEPGNYGWLKPPQEWYRHLSALPQRVDNIIKLIREQEVCLVHTNSHKRLEGALAAAICGVPSLYVAHTGFQPSVNHYVRFPLDERSFAQAIGHLCQKVIAVSEGVRATLCPPLSSTQVRVVHNGLEFARYDAALSAGRARSVRRTFGVDEGAVMIVAAGRIERTKGFDILVTAAAYAKRTATKSFKVVICGRTESPPYKAEVEEQSRRMGVADNIHFAGERADLPDVLAAADIFALPSRKEGHPYVLLEAMACNLPSVAAACDGVPETVVPGETGFVVPVEEGEAFGEKLQALIDDEELRTHMGEMAGQRVREHFSADRTAAGLFQAYEELIAGPGPNPGAYPVELLLRTVSEIGYLGTHITDLEERAKRMERAAELVLNNPVARSLRWLKARMARR